MDISCILVQTHFITLMPLQEIPGSTTFFKKFLLFSLPKQVKTYESVSIYSTSDSKLLSDLKTGIYFVMFYLLLGDK